MEERGAPFRALTLFSGGTDTDETTLVVVGGAEAAALLYRAGLHSLYTPVTWYEARADSQQGSISDCNWSEVSGRDVVIWLDEDAVASGRLELVARTGSWGGRGRIAPCGGQLSADRRRCIGGADRTGVAQPGRGW